MTRAWVLATLVAAAVAAVAAAAPQPEREAGWDRPQPVELDLSAAMSLRIACLDLQLDDEAARIFADAEAALWDAVSMAEAGEHEDAGERVEQARARYYEAILSALDRDAREVRAELEEARERLSDEEYEKAQRRVAGIEERIGRAWAERLEVDGLIELVGDSAHMYAGSPSADLVVKLWQDPYGELSWLTPNPPVAGATANITVLAQNIGLGSVTGPFETVLEIDGKHAKTWQFSPTAGGEAVSTYLETGDTLMLSHGVKLPAGKHQLVWRVDAKNSVSEASDSNNTLKASAEWKSTADLPDIAVDGITHAGQLNVGHEVTWKVKITNQGNTAVSTKFLTTLRLKGGSQFGTFWLNGLGKGASHTFEAKSVCVYSGGDVELVAMADAGNVVVEKDELNNTGAFKYKAEYADIAVQNLAVSPSTLYANGTADISFSLVNKGSQPLIKPFTVSVYPGQASGPYTQPKLIKVGAAKLPIKAGGKIDLKHSAPLPYPGPHQVKVEADFPNPSIVYQESDGANNVATKQVDVRDTWVKIASLKQHDVCRDRYDISLDLSGSGSHWKGQTFMELYVDGRKVVGGRWWFDPGSPHGYLSTHQENMNYSKTGVVKTWVRANGKWLKSRTPDRTVPIRAHEDPQILKVQPSKGSRAKWAYVTIEGKNLARPDGSSGLEFLSARFKDKGKTDKLVPKVKSASDTTIKASVYVPSNAMTGEYRIYVNACQSDFVNGLFFVEDAKASPKAELCVQPVGTYPSWPKAHQKVTFKFLVSNAGSAKAGASTARLYLDRGASGEQAKDVKVPQLLPGQTYPVAWAFDGGLSSGSHKVEIFADIKGEVAESGHCANYSSIGKTVGL